RSRGGGAPAAGGGRRGVAVTSGPPDQEGLVSLVGAGPGDPGLITVKGLERLRTAHVVVYDRLAPPELLVHAPDGARLVDVGKAPGRAEMSQDAINRTLVEEGRAGRRVVRLKGG